MSLTTVKFNPAPRFSAGLYGGEGEPDVPLPQSQKPSPIPYTGDNFTAALKSRVEKAFKDLDNPGSGDSYVPQAVAAGAIINAAATLVGLGRMV